MPYLVFLVGLALGSLLSRGKTVIVDKGEVVAEINNEHTVLVVRDDQGVQVRQVIDSPVPIKEPVENVDYQAFKRDMWGDYTGDCKTCMEDKAAEKEKTLWQTQ